MRAKPKSINCLNLGAGVQSSTVALLAETGKLEKPDFAIFADTQAETPDIYAHVDYIESLISFPLIRVTAGSLETAALAVHRNSITGVATVGRELPVFYSAHGKRQLAQRRCTTTFKVEPIRRHLHRYIKTGVTQWFGISTDEAGRMRESDVQYIANRYPLIELGMSRLDCVDWLQKNGFRVPNKSSCYFCPFHRDATWQFMKEHQPDQFNRAVAFERRLQDLQHTHESGEIFTAYLHRTLTPLDTAIFSPHSDPNGYINECSGNCGV